MKTLKSDFMSHGIRCDGDLLLPEGNKRPPVIIMAHGLAAQKNFGLGPYAEQFVKKGMAVFLFDYRTFGKSDGEPRQIVDPFRHLEDWRAAISHVRSLPDVDGGRIALWGSSFSGGHVLALASSEKNITAVISQIPFISGSSSIRMKRIPDILKSTAYGTYDLLRGFLRLSPHYSPVIARPGQFAAMNSEESYDGFMSIVGDDHIWENKMASRGFIKMAFYNPVAGAKKIKAPIMIIAGKDDSLIPWTAVKKISERISNCELVVLDCNHFAPYTGEFFKKYIGRHVEFMAGHLL